MGKRPKPPPPASSGRRATAQQQTSTTPPPSWPAFRPSLPVTDLSPAPLDACPGQVVLLRNFWPRSLCRDYVAFLQTLPLLTTPAVARRGMAVRVNDRFQIDDPAFATRLWTETGLREALGADGLREMWYV